MTRDASTATHRWLREAELGTREVGTHVFKLRGGHRAVRRENAVPLGLTRSESRPPYAVWALTAVAVLLAIPIAPLALQVRALIADLSAAWKQGRHYP